jgi:hypothetical protein
MAIVSSMLTLNEKRPWKMLSQTSGIGMPENMFKGHREGWWQTKVEKRQVASLCSIHLSTSRLR